MGDRTFVTLSLRTSDFNNANIDGLKEYDDIFHRSQTGVTDLEYYDVNYGTLDCEKELLDQSIPYDKHWEAGAQYSRGSFYLRFVDNEAVGQEFTEGEQNTVLLTDLINAQKNNEVDKFIERMIAEKKPACPLASLVEK